MKEKMIPAFRKAEGGLFTAVEKADVGSAYQEMEKQITGLFSEFSKTCADTCGF